MQDPFIERLQRAVGKHACLSTPAQLLVYECDGLTHFRTLPRAVVLPSTTEEVQSIVRICREERVPFTPRGAGTGLSGGATASPGGILIELSKMNRILAIDADSRTAVVQPGVINSHLSDAVNHLGLHYAPDPSSQTACSLGGNVAENAGGPHGLKYGSTERHVLAVKVVTADGDAFSMGHPTGAFHGLDLRGLFLGSEGTLGIATELTVRLTPNPEVTETVLAPFRGLRPACEAVSAVIAAGIVASALEALDDRTIAAVEASVFRAGYPTDAGAVLLLEFDGSEEDVVESVSRTRAILVEHNAMSVTTTRDPEQRKVLWRGRKGAFGAMGRLAPDLYVQDAVVPRTKLPDVLEHVGAICDRYRLRLANVFHAGDGNLHPNISYDGRDPDEVERVILAGREIIEACLRVGGTLSGEHGIGLEKQEFMPLLFTAADLDAMKRVRDVFDPVHIMNPGKVLPTPRACVEVRRPKPLGATP